MVPKLNFNAARGNPVGSPSPAPRGGEAEGDAWPKTASHASPASPAEIDVSPYSRASYTEKSRETHGAPKCSPMRLPSFSASVNPQEIQLLKDIKTLGLTLKKYPVPARGGIRGSGRPSLAAAI